MNLTSKSMSKISLAIFTIVFLSGCKFLDFSKKESSKKEILSQVVPSTDTSIVLLSIDGKPVLTEDEFNKSLMQMLQVNPYFRGASVDSLPAELKRKFFDEMIKQKLIVEWGYKNNIDQDSEFKKSFDEMMNLVKNSLFVQKFETKIFEDISVSDKEVMEHFNKNKEKFVKEPGGVLVEGLKFDNSGNAEAFIEKVKGKESEFKMLAKAENKDYFKNFGRIGDSQAAFGGASVPKEIKEKALTLKNLPAVEKVVVGDNVWVIYVSDKKDTKYFDFDEVKEQLEGMLKSNKFRDELNKKVDNLRGQFTVDVNEDFFKKTNLAPQEETAEEVGELISDEEVPVSTAA